MLIYFMLCLLSLKGTLTKNDPSEKPAAGIPQQMIVFVGCFAEFLSILHLENGVDVAVVDNKQLKKDQQVEEQVRKKQKQKTSEPVAGFYDYSNLRPIQSCGISIFGRSQKETTPYLPTLALLQSSLPFAVHHLKRREPIHTRNSKQQAGG